MKDTCELKNCPVAKKFKIKKENECPNFIESWWTPEGEKKPTLVKDCTNRRVLLMIQDLYNRLIGVQKSQEQMRNNYDNNQMALNLLSDNIRLNFKSLLDQRMERKVLEIASNREKEVEGKLV